MNLKLLHHTFSEGVKKSTQYKKYKRKEKHFQQQDPIPTTKLNSN